MLSEEKIAEYLMDTFSSVYCGSCSYQESGEGCDECHRKYMNWGLSEAKASKIAKYILEGE